MRLILLVALSLAASAAQLHIYVSQDVMGAHSTVRAVLEETIINNSSEPLTVGNLTVPPLGVATLERELPPNYPLPVVVTYRAQLVNGTLMGGKVVGSPPLGVRLYIDAVNLLPVDLVATVTVQVDRRMALLYGEDPTNVIRVGPYTVYSWALVLGDRANLSMFILVRDLGDWGALRPPPVRVSVRVDFGALASYQEERLKGLEDALERTEGFLEAARQIREAALGLAGNLTAAARLLNLSSALAGNASRAINVSLLLVESLKGQLLALSAALRGVSAEAERIRVLAEEQYAAMTSMGDLLEVQADAVHSYRATLNETAGTLSDAARRIYALSGSLLEAAYRLGQIEAELATLRDSVLRLGEQANLTGPASRTAGLIERARRVVIGAEDALIGLVETLRDLSGLLRVYSRDVSDMEAALRGTEAALRAAADSARRNATALREAIARTVDDLQRGLNETARGLEEAAVEAGQMARPVAEATRRLLDLAEAAAQLSANASALALDVKGNLPLLGAAESAILDAKHDIEREMQRIRGALATLDKYRSYYPANTVAVTYTLSLPTFMSPKTVELRVRVGQRAEGTTTGGTTGFAPYAAAASAAVGYLAYVSLKRSRRTSPWRPGKPV